MQPFWPPEAPQAGPLLFPGQPHGQDLTTLELDTPELTESIFRNQFFISLSGNKHEKLAEKQIMVT